MSIAAPPSSSVLETLSWVDSQGGVTSLSDYSFGSYFAEGPLPPIGQYGLPVTIVSHQVPLQAGTREQYVQIGANDIRFPLLVFGPDEPSLLYNVRTLAELMRSTRGLGQLQHTAADGAVRVLNCREVSSFRDVATRGLGWIRFGLIFSAADPYWYDQNWTTVVATPAGGVNFFAAPFLPLKLSVGGVSSNFTVYNGGQDVAWPVWTITGPGVNPSLTNNTTGQVLNLSVNLTAGQVLTVDTRPLYINVYREDGSQQWTTVSDVSQLWPLAVGANAISLAMTGTSAASKLQLQYRQAYTSV